MDRATLYDEDIVLWSEQQAEALRQLARTPERLPNDLDLENVIEEIESVGREQIYAVESRLRLIFAHLLKLASEPHSQAADHWEDEISNWHGDLLTRFAPSMAGRLNIDRIWIRALRQARRSVRPQEGLSSSCPYDLNELLSDKLDIEALLSRLKPLGAPDAEQDA